MIASAGTGFAAATEENVTRMSREIISLQNRLKAAEQEKSRLENEMLQLQGRPAQVNEVPLAVRKECDVLEMTMRQVYQEMFTLKQTVAPLAEAREETRQKHEQLKEASAALDKMMNWTTQYQQAPEHVPRKDWSHTQETKVQIRMSMQSKDKLSKDLDKVVSAYNHLISGIDSMNALHHIPSLGALNETKGWEQVEQEIQSFLQPVRQAAAAPEFEASQENLNRLLVTPVQIYTKLASLSMLISQKKETLVPNALECMHRIKEESPLVAPITADYQTWRDFLKGKKVDVPETSVARPPP